MKIRNQIALALGFCAIGLSGTASALIVNTSSDANLLASTILGSGITISNVTYSGAAVASGTFTDGLSSGIGIESGIILTSGAAASAVGPNVSDATTTSNGFAGDADLNGLIPGFSTLDATILEFDFESSGGDVFFNYVFASEEYNEWVGSSFNDVFGFFLDGSNIALVPGTSTAVSINNVNCGSTGVPPGGSNCGLYNNNDLSNGGGSFNLEYDGFIDVLTASFVGLSAGTHHIKLAIADAGDEALDSAVFIQAGSFSDKPVDVPEPTSLALMGLGLLGLGLRGRRKQKHLTLTK